MKKILIAVALVLALTSCTELKVVDVNPNTGHFPTDNKALILAQKPFDLDGRKGLLLIPKWDFSEEMIKRTGYFDELMTCEDLEKRIIAANLTEQVYSVRDRIGINRAAKATKIFLWLRFDSKGTGAETRYQLVLTDPLTMEDLFIAETDRDPIFHNFNDQHNWYPMFNALIDYIKANSKTYKN